MLQSNTFRATFLLLVRPASAHFARHFLAATLLLTGLHAVADVSFLDNDLGADSSAPGNSLIDSQALPADPAPPNLSPADAAALVRNKVGGQVMSVNSLRSESGIIYGVKILNEGRMRVIKVDGQTGQLLNQ